MIGISAFFGRKRADAGGNSGRPEDKPQREPGKPRARFIGGASEKTQDLIVCHDGERIGFRKPVEG